MWESRLTVCFAPADCGWASLLLASTAYGQYHRANLSYVSAPYHDLLDWLIDIADNRLPAEVLIDEEGEYSRLTVLPYDNDWLEFRAGRVGEPSDPLGVSIVCRVRQREFLAEWRRRFKDFLALDYRPEDWEGRAWNDYLYHGDPYPRRGDLRRLDFARLDAWLEWHRPRTRSIERLLCEGTNAAEIGILEWAKARGLPTQVKNPDTPQPDWAFELRALPEMLKPRQKIKNNVRDSDGVLLLSHGDRHGTRGHLACLYANRFGKPCLHLHPGMPWRLALSGWLGANGMTTINIIADADVTFASQVISGLWEFTGNGAP
jgi:hypothetical protein